MDASGDNPFVIARYTRPEMGAIWTDAARMERWREVEVAAAQELEGPTAEELDAIAAASFTVEAVRERDDELASAGEDDRAGVAQL
jgi:adenylosuccinate lyase